MENIKSTSTPLARAAARRSALPYLALAASVMSLSVSAFFVRWAEAPGTITSFYRMLTAIIVMLPIFLVHLKHSGGLKVAPAVLLLPIAAGIFSSFDHTLWTTAMEHTLVANATLLNNISPLWVGLFAILAWKERLGRRFWLGLILTMSGAALVFGNDMIANPHLGVGDALSLASSLFYAGLLIFSQLGRQFFKTLPFTFISVTACCASLLGINLALGHPLSGYSQFSYLCFILAGIISQVIGYFTLNYALGHLRASVVAPTMIAQPILTAFLAIPLLGEVLSPAQSIGGLTVLAGIYIVNRARHS